MIAIVDIGVGNTHSIQNMLNRLGLASNLIDQPENLADAETVILPGIGSFDNFMIKLEEANLIDIIHMKALYEKVPFIGICVGMQAMFQGSQEGHRNGLGWFDGELKKFAFNEKQESDLRVPHLGWNYAQSNSRGKIIPFHPTPRYYFAHSYYVAEMAEENILCKTNYGIDFISGIQSKNITGVQFHPEKSHTYGLEFFQKYFEKIKC